MTDIRPATPNILKNLRNQFQRETGDVFVGTDEQIDALHRLYQGTGDTADDDDRLVLDRMGQIQTEASR